MWPTIFKIWNQSLPIYKCFCIMKIFNNSSKFLFPYNYWEINSCQKYLFSSHTYTHIYSPTTVHTNVFILISSIKKKKQKVCVYCDCVCMRKSFLLYKILVTMLIRTPNKTKVKKVNLFFCLVFIIIKNLNFFFFKEQKHTFTHILYYYNMNNNNLHRSKELDSTKVFYFFFFYFLKEN